MPEPRSAVMNLVQATWEDQHGTLQIARAWHGGPFAVGRLHPRCGSHRRRHKIENPAALGRIQRRRQILPPRRPHHMRGLSKEMKRAAVQMALDAAASPPMKC
jgi:hypothetical protein